MNNATKTNHKKAGEILTFGERLKNERIAAGLSQDALSALCGISQHTWSKYETGAWQPKFERILAIADTLNISTDYLLCRTDERKNIAL